MSKYKTLAAMQSLKESIKVLFINSALPKNLLMKDIIAAEGSIVRHCEAQLVLQQKLESNPQAYLLPRPSGRE